MYLPFHLIHLLICAVVYGILAILWWIIIIYHAVARKNYSEMYTSISLLLWLVANFWWMFGEVVYPNDDDMYTIFADQSAVMLMVEFTHLLILI